MFVLILKKDYINHILYYDYLFKEDEKLSYWKDDQVDDAIIKKYPPYECYLLVLAPWNVTSPKYKELKKNLKEEIVILESRM